MKRIMAIFILAARCGYMPTPVPPDTGDAEDCAKACDNLARLQCPGWRGSPGMDDVWYTKDDWSCTEVCRDLVTEETMTLYQICTADAQSCEEVERCFDEGNH